MFTEERADLVFVLGNQSRVKRVPGACCLLRCLRQVLDYRVDDLWIAAIQSQSQEIPAIGAGNFGMNIV